MRMQDVMFEFKQGVLLYKDGVQVQPVIIEAMSTVAHIYDKFNQKLVITSVVDGVHSKKSLHYQGLAFDTRIWYFSEEVLKEVYTCLSIALGKDFDVVLESDHFHIEYDPC